MFNTHNRSIGLLILVTLIWGTSFPLQKYLLDYFSPAVILATRFGVAAIAFSPWLRGINRQLLRDGVLLGSLYFLGCALALVGLETISASRSAFLVSLNAILVPVLSATMLGRNIPGRVMLSACMAVFGIGLMSWDGGGLHIGDGLTFICAVIVAAYILLVERLASKHSTFPLTAVQLFTMAVLGLVWAMPQLWTQGHQITTYGLAFVYLGVVVTATPIWGQALAQRWLAAYETALIFTLEPVFATLLSFLFLGDILGLQGAVGASIVMSATLLSQVPPAWFTHHIRLLVRKVFS